MRTVRLGALLGTLVTPVLLGVLSLATGLSVAGWFVGLAAGWTTTALLVAGRAHREPPGILPPDWVTLTRALVIAGVASLVADSFTHTTHVTAIVVLASIALVLDAVDGQVARRTGTETSFGARLDGEVDAFLILLLSVEVARDYGDWVLAIGAFRYAFLVAGWALPWLAAPLPSRYWRRLVATVQGVVLTIAASGALPRAVGMVVLGIALVVLAVSFGQCVVWLYHADAGSRSPAMDDAAKATRHQSFRGPSITSSQNPSVFGLTSRHGGEAGGASGGDVELWARGGEHGPMSSG